ncbi:MAG: penicillin-binding transpeptidase domain-containing protein, partial [Patescibacteria group bacterium]
EDISLTDAEKANIVTVGEGDNAIDYLYLDKDSHYRIQVFKTVMETGKTIVSKFRNILGAGTYRNRAVSDIYEPGSIFKTIAMAIALDDGDVSPNTTFNDTGSIKVDEFEIHNALNTYYGITSMREVLEKSLNTGMAYVARKIGRELFYRYLLKFGFGERTDIEFEGEEPGRFKEASSWAESELITYAFGQGIAVTPIQMITALSALANKGILMKPHIVLTITSQDGKKIEIEPEQVRRVISEKTAATIGAMMVSAVDNGVAKKAAVPGYKFAGKTGTAQTYKNGKPLTGPGTTICSFAGFGPYSDPKFVMLVKIDRPRSSIWADATAAPLSAQIAQFLFKYYNIQPDVSVQP